MAEREDALIVTLTNHKGGVGKTVSAVHIAAALAQKTRPGLSTPASGRTKPVGGAEGGGVLLIDSDPNLSALSWWERGRESGAWMPFDAVDPVEAGEVIGLYEHVVIDTEGRVRGDGLERLWNGCDLLVAPTTPDEMDVDVTQLLLDDLAEMREERLAGGREAGAPCRVLLVSTPSWWKRTNKKARVELEQRGVAVLNSEIRQRGAFRTAFRTGVLVRDAAHPKSADGWEDYMGLATEILTYDPIAEDEKDEKEGGVA